MNRFWRRASAALLAALTLTAGLPAALGAGVEVDGVSLPPDQGWIGEGTSYITLRAWAAISSSRLSWDGQRAVLEGEDLILTAKPGNTYVMANGRPIFVPETVRAPEGKLVVPLRTLAQALGAELSWDGESGTARLDTKKAVPIAAMPRAEEDLYWLARIISAESRGEPYEGQLAVGNVVLNRVAHPDYPDTIKGVIFDTRGAVQFEPVENGTVFDAPAESSLRAAKECLAGAKSTVGDSLFFFAPALSPGTWIVENREYATTIGGHRFYR